MKVNRAKFECGREDHPCPRFCTSTVVYSVVADGSYGPTRFADASVGVGLSTLCRPVNSGHQRFSTSVLQYISGQHWSAPAGLWPGLQLSYPPAHISFQPFSKNLTHTRRRLVACRHMSRKPHIDTPRLREFTARAEVGLPLLCGVTKCM